MVDNFAPGFTELLAKLNEHIAQTGEPVEGNIFYNHHDDKFPHADITDWCAGKRENLINICKGRHRLLEIGINAGHSALLMLYHNPRLHYVGVDICIHQYTYKAVEFLKEHFPGRVDFFLSDSVVALPEIYATRPDLRFDVAMIDGLHTDYHCSQDIINSLKMMTPFGWVIVDDTDMENIANVYADFVKKSLLLDKKPEGWISDNHHAIGMAPK